MPQSVAQLPACSECGSEPLGQALFCFNCGARLKVEEPEETASEPEETGDEPSSVIDRPIEPPQGDPFEQAEEKGEEGEAEDKGAEEDGSGSIGKTASAIRQGEGLMRMRRIETRWTPDESSPNLWFIVASTVFFLAALGIFFLSMYLR